MTADASNEKQNDDRTEQIAAEKIIIEWGKSSVWYSLSVLLVDDRHNLNQSIITGQSSNFLFFWVNVWVILYYIFTASVSEES